MPANPLDEEALFHAARRIADPEERARFIEQACGDNARLAERVRALVAMHEQESDRRADAAPLAASTQDYAPVAERPGARVGPYRLMEQIGEGGFGLVFVAEQQEPVKRKVALKIIKPGMDSHQVIARFEAERQALALMDHPNIARVLDAGATDSGRPYFVMELVRGVPITEYCDKHQLSPQERLELFITVCQAIQHAHQKGIIHRDVKPSNVLVTSHDGKPVAKVIDFGVAKAIHQQLTEKTIYTHFAQMIGTPLYMSPEQAEMSGLDIDTRSDIYSLGVLLYELLTGTTPLEKQRLRQAAYDEVRRLIREEEPPKPSTRLSTSESIAAVAAHRKMEPAKLSKLVRGDLDWITMKALEKDRTRRYETANGLARDIQRYLSDEPVEASPPSTAYRLRKLARKHRTVLTTAAAFVVLLVAGAGVATWQAVRATQALTAADKAAIAEKVAADKEREAAALALTRLQEIEKANSLLESIFTDVNPRLEKQGGPLLIEQLTRRLLVVADKLDTEAIRDPLTVARLQSFLGIALRNLGEYGKAIELHQNAWRTRAKLLGSVHPTTLVSMGDLADGYRAAGKLDLAVPLLEETFKLCKAKLGPDHHLTLISMNDLATGYQNASKLDLAVPLLEEALKLSKATLGPEHHQTLVNMGNLAGCYRDVGKLDLALQLFEETFKIMKPKLGPDHPDTLTSMNHLANCYLSAGKLDLALPLCQETLKLRKAKLGPDHPDTLRSMVTMANGYEATGKRDLALPLREETLTRMKAKLGPDHPNTLTSMHNLANCYWRLGRLDQSIPLFEEVLKLKEKKLGRAHRGTQFTVADLGVNYRDAGRLAEALPLLEEAHRASRTIPSLRWVGAALRDGYTRAGKGVEALALAEETLKLRKAELGLGHPDTLSSMADLADAYRNADKLDLALPLYEETLKLRTAKLGPDHPQTLLTMFNLADAYRAAGKLDQAIGCFQGLWAGRRKTLPANHRMVIDAQNHLGWTLALAGDFSEAEKLLLASYRAIQEAKEVPPDWLPIYGERLGDLYLRWEKINKAVPLFEQALAQRKQKLGPDHLDTLRSMNTLANGYRVAGKLDLARALAKDLVAGARQSLPRESPQLAGTLAQGGLTLLQLHAFADAEPVLRECLAIREKQQADLWSTFNAHSMLGGALLGQKKHQDAEPLLLKGYTGMKARAKTIPPQSKVYLTEAAERLVQLYEATGNAAEAERWRKEVAEHKAAENAGKK
jgi:serine/threonine protein kinase/tetratricopeptide (TPR) repeat protein